MPHLSNKCLKLDISLFVGTGCRFSRSGRDHPLVQHGGKGMCGWWEQNVPGGGSAAQEGSVGMAQCSWRWSRPVLLLGAWVPLPVTPVGMVQRAQSSREDGLSLSAQLPIPLLPALCPR